MKYFSQYGEDKWIADNLPVPDRGIFVDVGAADGEEISNTLYFEQRGWRGLCIEADRRHLPMLRATRACLIHACAVATEQRMFYQTSTPFLSGLLREGQGTPTTVECHRLDTLLRHHHIPNVDLLSIDVEGSELDVWESLGEHCRPPIVIVEHDTIGLADNSAGILSTFAAAGYRMAHRTPGNFIFTTHPTA